MILRKIDNFERNVDKFLSKEKKRLEGFVRRNSKKLVITGSLAAAGIIIPLGVSVANGEYISYPKEVCQKYEPPQNNALELPPGYGTVPEPSSVILLGSGLTYLLRRRRN